MSTIRPLVAALIALITAAAPAAAAALRVTYDTDEAGPMTLEFDGHGVVAGAYPDFHGRLEGMLDDNTRRIEGLWWQTQATVDAIKCAIAVKGTFYWGKFVLIEDADAKGFHGKWGNCNQEPSESWIGQLRVIAGNGS